MKRRLLSLSMTAACAAAMAATVTGKAGIVEPAYAASVEAEPDKNTSIAVSSAKTEAETTSEQSAGGYKVIRRNGGSLDLSFAYNAVPKNTGINSAAKAKKKASGSSEQGISDTETTEEKETKKKQDVAGASSTSSENTITETSENNSASGTSENANSTAQATSSSNAGNTSDSTSMASSTRITVQTPKCVKQVIRFNANADAEIDYDAICKKYEPSNHGSSLSRSIEKMYPADEALGNISDPDIQEVIEPRTTTSGRGLSVAQPLAESDKT